MNKEKEDLISKKMLILGKNVKFYREKIGMSIENLAQSADMSQKFLKRLEEGQVVRLTLAKLLKIMEILQITSEEIFYNMWLGIGQV